MRVPLHFANAEVSPAFKLSGALISHITTEVEIACLPKDLPEFIEVDLAEMTTQRAMHVSDLKLPAGVSVVRRGKANPVVAAAVVPKANVEAEAEAAAAAEGAAAPAAEAAAKAEPAKKAPAKEEKKK